jgi:hypothetical protein
LHADVRGTGETRAGGFLFDPLTDNSLVSPLANASVVSLVSESQKSSVSDHKMLSEEEQAELAAIEEKLEEEELWDCFCGTCSGCVMIAAKKVPERLYLPNNNSLGPDRSKQFKALDERQQHSDVSADMHTIYTIYV